MGALSELARRWQPVTDYLRRHQTASLLPVTRDRHLGLLVLLAALLLWPDTDFGHCLLTGFPGVGDHQLWRKRYRKAVWISSPA